MLVSKQAIGLVSELMMIAIANSKGGVGKSTLAVHLAVWAFDHGLQTAVIDCDKQRSSSTWLAEAEPKITIAVVDLPEECLSIGQDLLQSHDFVIGDGPAGLDDVSRTLLILADIAILPLTPSILDIRSVQQAAGILKYAQAINKGKPEGRIVLNKFRLHDNISKELRIAAPRLGIKVCKSVIRDLGAYRDAAQQASVVSRMGRKTESASAEMDQLFFELLGKKFISNRKTHSNQKIANQRRVANG